MQKNDEPGMTPADEPGAISTEPTPAAAAAPTPGAPKAAATPKPPAAKPGEQAALTGSQVMALLGIVALTVIAIVLYSQERTIDDLAQQVRNLGSEQQRMAAQLTSRSGFTPADIDVAGAPALGPASDVVTLIEFS